MREIDDDADELYQDDGRKKMAESLVEQHPDVTTVTWKWGRWQHHVDYKPFRKNKLIRKPDVVETPGSNNYGMKLKFLTEQERAELAQREDAEASINQEEEQECEIEHWQ
jgi:exopolysaccharide biosynthesis predicted pyruvyltransferase EpsI